MSGDDPEKVGSNNDNVNDRRRQFLTDIRSHMENYLIKDMPEWIKRYLDIECPVGSLWRRTVWKKFVNNMGITDSGVLNKIEHIADVKSEQGRLLSQNAQNNSITFQNAEGQITVLIPHSKEESRVAGELSAEFRKNDIISKTLTEVVQHGTETDLNTLFKKADFIVPVVSSTFIREIEGQFPTSAYEQYNRSLYKLISDDYSFNRRRVRPVIVKEMKRKWVRDPMFRYTFKLWNEVPKLIHVLKQTKEERTRLIN